MMYNYSTEGRRGKGSAAPHVGEVAIEAMKMVDEVLIIVDRLECFRLHQVRLKQRRVPLPCLVALSYMANMVKKPS